MVDQLPNCPLLSPAGHLLVTRSTHSILTCCRPARLGRREYFVPSIEIWGWLGAFLLCVETKPYLINIAAWNASSAIKPASIWSHN